MQLKVCRWLEWVAGSFCRQQKKKKKYFQTAYSSWFIFCTTENILMIAILISQIHYLLFLLKPKEWKIKRKKKETSCITFWWEK